VLYIIYQEDRDDGAEIRAANKEKHFAYLDQHEDILVLGGALAVLCGLILWGTPIGDAWVNASYDYQFRFGSRAVSNHVVLIQMEALGLCGRRNQRRLRSEQSLKISERNFARVALSKATKGAGQADSHAPRRDL